MSIPIGFWIWNKLQKERSIRDTSEKLKNLQETFTAQDVVNAIEYPERTSSHSIRVTPAEEWASQYHTASTISQVSNVIDKILFGIVLVTALGLLKKIM